MLDAIGARKSLSFVKHKFTAHRHFAKRPGGALRTLYVSSLSSYDQTWPHCPLVSSSGWGAKHVSESLVRGRVIPHALGGSQLGKDLHLVQSQKSAVSPEVGS